MHDLWYLSIAIVIFEIRCGHDDKNLPLNCAFRAAALGVIYYDKPTFGANRHQTRHTNMFIAIIGTRLSGKSTVETYLTQRGFIPVRVISQTPEHGVTPKTEAQTEVSYLHSLFLSRPTSSTFSR